MPETLTYESTDQSVKVERIVSDMEREAIVLRYFGVTAVNAASSPLENKIYHIEDLQEPVYND